MTEEQLPTLEEWGDCSIHEDREYAFKHYYNRSNEQMMGRFISAPIEVASELQFMSAIPFQYYIVGFSEAVLAVEKNSEVNSDAASCFLRLVDYKSSKSAKDVLPIYPKLKKTLEYVANNQSSFGAQPEIYGNFKSIHEKILRNIGS